MAAEDEALSEWMGRMVVVDVAQPVVYIGRLAGVDRHFYTLEDADMHDLGVASRATYILEAKKNGVIPVRRTLKVRVAQVLSLSPIDEVVTY